MIRSPGRVAAAPIAPSARNFHATGDYCTADAASSLIRVSTSRSAPPFCLPRALHLARSRLHSRPHTCVLRGETRRGARQCACGIGGRREGAHFAPGPLGWAARCCSRRARGVGGARHTQPRVVRGGDGRDRGTDGRRVRAVRASRRSTKPTKTLCDTKSLSPTLCRLLCEAPPCKTQAGRTRRGVAAGRLVAPHLPSEALPKCLAKKGATPAFG